MRAILELAFVGILVICAMIYVGFINKGGGIWAVDNNIVLLDQTYDQFCIDSKNQEYKNYLIGYIDIKGDIKAVLYVEADMQGNQINQIFYLANSDNQKIIDEYYRRVEVKRVMDSIIDYKIF